MIRRLPPVHFIRQSLLVLLALLTPGRSPAQDSAQELNAAIDHNRKGLLVIHARPGAKIAVEQERHEFWFGAALANQAFDGGLPPADRDQYLRLFLTNFNSAVTENALKWHCMEQKRGQVHYGTVDAILSWADQHELPLRGHNIYWGIPNRVQDWLKSMPDAEFRETLKQRGLDVGGRYKGRFAEYDLNNEMIHGNYYEQRLGTNITLDMAGWVHQADPKAALYLNDYDILTGVKLDDYLRHIRTLLAQGVPIAGIGVQGHLHGEAFDPKALHNALEKLSEFKLPIRVTEFNMPGQRSKYCKDTSLRLNAEEEQAKARAIVDYYRICFSYPMVKGILMWGFWEGANWIPASSLYRRDWTPLPAAAAYQNLVFREWWTRWEGTADSTGQVSVRAFYGKHRITVDGRTRMANLSSGIGTCRLSFE